MKSDEIARLSGVSCNTVSRVVNNYPNVSEETRRKVLDIISATNTYPTRLQGRWQASRTTQSQGFATPSGKTKWQSTTVQSILTNAKYSGDAILQKRFTVDFLTKKTKVNEGEVPKYIVENNYPAIIPKEVFDLVQQEMKKRKGNNHHKSCVNCFSGKVVCGECGIVYGSKLWHSASPYRRTVWQCNGKFTNHKKCTTPHLYESKLRQAFVEAFNYVLTNKAEILDGYEVVIAHLTDTTVLEEERKKVEAEIASIIAQIESYIQANASTKLNQGEYLIQHNVITAQYNEALRRRAELETQIGMRTTQRNQMNAFIRILSDREHLLEEFDESIFAATVDRIVVHSDSEINFNWKDGSELPWITK